MRVSALALQLAAAAIARPAAADLAGLGHSGVAGEVPAAAGHRGATGEAMLQWEEENCVSLGNQPQDCHFEVTVLRAPWIRRVWAGSGASSGGTAVTVQCSGASERRSLAAWQLPTVSGT